MKRLAAVLFGMLAAFALTVGEVRAERRVALVVGNSAYQNAQPLPNPVNDARAMAALFRNAGFEVVEAKLDLGNLEFKRVAREFAAITRDADIAVIFYAGHGIEVNGTNYLIPVDAKLATDFDIEDEALSLDRLVRTLEPAKRLRLIILDACRDNPFVRTMRRSVSTRSVANGLAKVEPVNTDTLIAFAAKAGSTADDGRGSNSPFTTALLNNLVFPGRDVRIALGFVRDEVVRVTGNKQEPFVYGSLGGTTITLVPDGKSETAAIPEPKRENPVQVAPPVLALPSLGLDPRRDYEVAERVGTKEAWDAFLSIHTSGLYADLARAQRNKAAARPGPQVSATALVPPAPDPAPAAKIAVLSPGALPQLQLDPSVLARDLKSELKRVGCDPGTVDGGWSAKSRDALDQFNRRAGMKLEIQSATVGALDAVKSQRGRICPLVCASGQRADGERCVAVPVAPKQAPKKEAARPNTRARAEPVPVRSGRPPTDRDVAGPSGGQGSSPISIGVGGLGIGLGGIGIGLGR